MGVGQTGKVDVHVEEVLTLVNERLHDGDQEVVVFSVLCAKVKTFVNFSQRIHINVH